MAMEARIIRSARALIGVKFKLCGRSMRGVDCAGLIYFIAKRNGLSMPLDDFTSYSRSNRKSHVLARMRSHFRSESRSLCKPGMVLVVSPREALTHLAVLVTMRKMIHASNDPGVMRVIESPVNWSVVAGVFSFREKVA